MLWVYGQHKYVNSYSAGIDFSRQNLTYTGDKLWSSECDVCRRQILTSKVDPRAVRVKIFLMAADP